MKIEVGSKLASERIGLRVWQKHGMQGEVNLSQKNVGNISFPLQVSLPCLRFLEGGKEEEEEDEGPRQYSWDVARQTLDLSQFTIDRLVLTNPMNVD